MASVARRFAKALADVVLAKHQAEQVKSELQHFSNVLTESPALVNVLTSPSVVNPQKKKLIEAIVFRAGYSETTRNFLNILVDHRRFNLFSEIAAAFQQELDRRLGVESIEVTTAEPLPPEQQKQLADRLHGFTKKEVRLQFYTDPILIGGLVAKIGSTVYDGSIRDQLNRLRAHLIGD